MTSPLSTMSSRVAATHRPTLPTWRVIAALCVAAAVVGWSVRWGQRVQLDERVKLGAAPLVGQWDWHASWRIIAALTVAAFVITFFDRITQDRRWSLTLLAAGFATGAWTLTLALADGFDRVLVPVVDPTEYWANLPIFPSVPEMIKGAADIDYLLQFSVHIKGHPPGFPMMLVGLNNLGLAQPWIIGMLSWVGAAIVTPAVLTCVRNLVDEHHARRVAAFLILAPYAVWMGTSADAVFAAFLFTGLALVTTAMKTHGHRTAVGTASIGGLLFGWTLMMTYGASTFMVAPALVVLAAKKIRFSRRFVVASAGAAGALAVVVLMDRLGFYWRDGLETVRLFYWAGTAQFRPWAYFMVGNVGTLFIAIGPAAIIGLVGRFPKRAWLLCLSGIVAITAANISQLSKGEVERIWLIFMPVLLTATMNIERPRRWLCVQAAIGVILQVWLISKW